MADVNPIAAIPVAEVQGAGTSVAGSADPKDAQRFRRAVKRMSILEKNPNLTGNPRTAVLRNWDPEHKMNRNCPNWLGERWPPEKPTMFPQSGDSVPELLADAAFGAGFLIAPYPVAKIPGVVFEMDVLGRVLRPVLTAP